jgi:hypothetical protein
MTPPVARRLHRTGRAAQRESQTVPYGYQVVPFP